MTPTPSQAVDDKWFGDMMILQVLADSDNVNEQEREVLTRWMAASYRPSQRRNAGVAGTFNDQQESRNG